MAAIYQPVFEDFSLHSDDQFNNDVQTWSFTETIMGLALVLLAYLILVLKIIPSYMKNKAPYRLNNIMLVYNAFQVAFSLYLVFIYIRYILNYGVITTRCPKQMDLKEVISEIYPYFFAKHLDLLDTIFFALRKKNNQITFLHLYHHTTMITWTWFHLVYYPTDHFVVVGMLNSFVHVLMYAYYGLSSLGPEYAKYVWWKKHLTKIQLVQFILVVSHLHYQQKLTPCPIPSFFHFYCLTLILSFFLLFMKFYFQNYKSKLAKQTRQPTEYIDDKLIKAR